jgi:hypothetical protein
MAKDRVQLSDEAVQLAVGKGKPGEACQVSNLVSRDL